MDHQQQGHGGHHKRRRNIVPKVCNGIAAFLLVCVIVLGAVGVGLPRWATLTPRNASDGVHRKVAVGMFDLGFTSVYPDCLPVVPMCRPTPSFSIETGNKTSDNTINVSLKSCWLKCNNNNKLEVSAMIDTAHYLSQLQSRIQNATQGEIIADMTIAVRCRNFVAPRGLIIAGISIATFSLCLVMIGMKFSMVGWIASCLCMCAFVVQLIGLILASVYSVRPCDRMNESWNYTLGPSFILLVISTALLLVVCLLITCSVVAYLVGRGAQAASDMRGQITGHHNHSHGGDAEMGLAASSSTDPLHRPQHGGYGGDVMYGQHQGGSNGYVHIAGIPSAGGRGGGSLTRGDLNMQQPAPSHSVGIPIPITTPAGPMTMPNVPFGSHVSHGPYAPGTIVTHTTHVEEHTVTQQTPEA